MCKKAAAMLAFLALLAVVGLWQQWGSQGHEAQEGQPSPVQADHARASLSRWPEDGSVLSQPQMKNEPELTSAHERPGSRESASEWDEFRRKHPRLALASELAVTWALNAPLHDLATACVAADVGFPDVFLRARVAIQDRDIFIEDIECKPTDVSGNDHAERLCECLFAVALRELHAELPDDVPAEDFVDYRGSIVLPHWTMVSAHGDPSPSSR